MQEDLQKPLVYPIHILRVFRFLMSKKLVQTELIIVQLKYKI
jgi:hypothetical protein